MLGGGLVLAGWLIVNGAPLLKDETVRKETVRRVKAKVSPYMLWACSRHGGLSAAPRVHNTRHTVQALGEPCLCVSGQQLPLLVRLSWLPSLPR